MSSRAKYDQFSNNIRIYTYICGIDAYLYAHIKVMFSQTIQQWHPWLRAISHFSSSIYVCMPTYIYVHRMERESLLIHLWLIFLGLTYLVAGLILISLSWIYCMSASWCHSVVFRFIAYPFLLLLCQWKEEDQVNQQCERYWLKHHHFLYCVWMTVTTNLEAMHEYVWMSICVYSLKEIRKKKSERERRARANERKLFVRLMLIFFSFCSFFWKCDVIWASNDLYSLSF